MANENLKAAKKAKNDEFYTQYYDIELEMKAYLEYNPDVFLDKTVLCPCDDPECSNFTLFFVRNFKVLGIKKLISTSLATDSRRVKGNCATYHIKTETGEGECAMTNNRGKLFIMDNAFDAVKTVDSHNMNWSYLEGDGDFRSEEVTRFRDEADIIITNPPFSLFREFLAWIMSADKKFVIIGNMNAITYKETFPLIKGNKIWLGESIHSGDREFRVPDDYPITAAGWRIDEKGNKYIRVKGVRWYTNIDHGLRHQPLALMTMKDNIRDSKHKDVKGQAYQHYDNYDAIEVPYTDAIPSDYEGVMGVPISFLDKYCPEQFDILGITENNPDLSDLWISGYTKYDRPYINRKRKYSRLLIRKIQ